ncbi:MAG: hypothetical protein HZB38_17695 [Planctomycetes bacterium]|nr:hypothetical protein [Planctomycetota bacterium]
MTAGRTLPWLQTTSENDVWQLWGVDYRDVVVLDSQNRRVTAYNLTTYDLSDAANYAELKRILLEAANQEE